MIQSNNTTQNKNNYIPATDNLAYWGYFINNGHWFPRPFDKLIIKLLYYAEMGKVTKILLSVPSRHGKSTLISKIFASYYLCKYPNDKIILSSYSQDLASEFGGEVKNIINYYGQYTQNAPELRNDSKAKHKFNLAPPYTGQMLAVGAAGSILGFGANLFIIDDPIKNIAEAESTTIQNKLHNWFRGTATTRLEQRPNGKPPIMIVIAQRLNTHDLQGLIKENEPYIPAKEALTLLDEDKTIPSDTWVDMNLQAICTNPETDPLERKKGEVLWQEHYNYNTLMTKKKSMGSYLFNAVYQGEPVELDGELYLYDWFYNENGDYICTITLNEFNEIVGNNGSYCRVWDLAASNKNKNITERKREQTDEVCGMLSCYYNDIIYLMPNPINNRFTPLHLEEIVRNTTLNDGKYVTPIIEGEPGSHSNIWLAKLQRDVRKQGIYLKIQKPLGSKVNRSHQARAAFEGHRIKFVYNPGGNNAWIKKSITQLISFDGDDKKHDDIVDAIQYTAMHWEKPKPRINIY